MKFNMVLSLLKEDNDVTGNELADQITATIKKHFPNSGVNVKFSSGIANSITGHFAIGKDKSEWANGIIHNDPAHTIFHVYGFDKDGNQKGGLELTGSIYGYNNYSTKVKDKAGWRNIKSGGSASTVIKALDKYFSNLKSVVDSDKGK
jgi:hypothetical protein